MGVTEEPFAPPPPPFFSLPIGACELLSAHHPRAIAIRPGTWCSEHLPWLSHLIPSTSLRGGHNLFTDKEAKQSEGGAGFTQSHPKFTARESLCLYPSSPLKLPGFTQTHHTLHPGAFLPPGFSPEFPFTIPSKVPYRSDGQ